MFDKKSETECVESVDDSAAVGVTEALCRSKLLLAEMQDLIGNVEQSYKIPLQNPEAFAESTETKLLDGSHCTLYRLKTRYQAELAEFLGTFVFLFIGYSSNAQMNVGMEVNKGNWVTMVIGWGIGLTIGVCLAGGYSGAHLNPIVTFNLWLFRDFPFRKTMRYWLAQFFGAMLASAWSFILYYPALRQFEPHAWSLKSGGSFYTTTQAGMPVASSWFNEVSGSAILLAVILSVNDPNNVSPVKGLNALIFGMTITCLGSCAGYYTPFGLNPVRDLGPRLVMSMMGFPKSIWYDHKLWWLVGGITAPTLGGLLGCCAYDFFIYVPSPPCDYPPYKKLRSVTKWFTKRTRSSASEISSRDTLGNTSSTQV